MRWKIISVIISAILCYHNVNPIDTEVSQIGSEEVESVPVNHNDHEKEHDYYDDEKESKDKSVEQTFAEPIPVAVQSVVNAAPNISNALQPRMGAYINYEYLSALELNDQNYDWNGKCHRSLYDYHDFTT